MRLIDRDPKNGVSPSQEGLRFPGPRERAGEARHRIRLLLDCYLRFGKARQTNEVLEQTYPRDEWSPNDLSIIYDQIDALAEAQEAARRDPASGRFYANLAYAYLNSNRFDEAQTAEEGQAKKLDSP